MQISSQLVKHVNKWEFQYNFVDICVSRPKKEFHIPSKIWIFGDVEYFSICQLPHRNETYNLLYNKMIDLPVCLTVSLNAYRTQSNFWTIKNSPNSDFTEGRVFQLQQANIAFIELALIVITICKRSITVVIFVDLKIGYFMHFLINNLYRSISGVPVAFLLRSKICFIINMSRYTRWLPRLRNCFVK